jgi:hypothetical protein
MMDLHERLVEEGCETYCTWVVEDHQVGLIGDDSERDVAGKQVLDGMNFLKRLNEVYGGCIAQVSSLNLRNGVDYISTFGKLKGAKKVIEGGLEELATFAVMDTDIRIGSEKEALSCIETLPPRAANLKPYSTIYLTRSGSPNFKIDPVNDSLETVKEFIDGTEDKRDLLDLCLVGKMARDRLNVPDFPTSFLSVHPDDFSLTSLRENAFALYKDNINPYFN